MDLKKIANEILNNIVYEWLEFIANDDILKKEFTECIQRLPLGNLDKITPPPHMIFNALKYVSPSKVKVVIIGQDPYKKLGEAMGLSFSVPKSKRVPPSLRNIEKALINSNLIEGKLKHGSLISWARQGVLMLNASLTTIIGKSNEHVFWVKFTDRLIELLCKTRVSDPLIFILWGRNAQQKESLIGKEHHVLKWSHPSPMGDNNLPEIQRFKNCDNFLVANDLLEEMEKQAINWGNLDEVTMFTDGGASQNGKANAKAKYAFYIEELGVKVSGNVERTEKYAPSNQRGELMGIITGLEYICENCNFVDCIVVTDSAYCKGIIESWLEKWKLNNELEEKKNTDLILRLDSVLQRIVGGVVVKHINSHQPEPSKTSAEYRYWLGNKTADELCHF